MKKKIKKMKSPMMMKLKEMKKKKK